MNQPATHPREEEAAAYVFGHMAVAERAAFARDLESDAVLRQVVEALSEAAAALSLTVPQKTPPPAVKDRVLKSVKGITQEGSTRPSASGPAQRSGGGALIGWSVAAAFAVVGVMLWNRVQTAEQKLVASESKLRETMGWVKRTEALIAESRTKNETLQASLDHAEQAGKELQQSLAKVTEAAGVLKQELASKTLDNKNLEDEKAVVLKRLEMGNMQIATLKSTIAEYKQGVAVVVWDSAKQEGVLKLEKMPPVDSNKDYQLWVVDPSKKAPVNAGVIRVDPKGNAKVQFKPNMEIQQADKFALSVEKKVANPGGVPDNAGPIVLLSP